MKKDIEIKKVEDLELAVIQEYNSTFKVNDWYVYLINKRPKDLELVLIVSDGKNDQSISSTMRHKIEKLPANSVAKIELMQEEVLKLDNYFKVTFFEDNHMFEKTFKVPKNSIKEGALRHLKILNKKGVIFK